MKKVGGNAGTPLQKVNYRYNIRGWLTAINDLDSLNINGHGDFFAYKIRYDERIGLENPNTNFPTYKVKPKYNGNIAEVDWISLYTAGQQGPIASNADRYGYVYDGLDRLKAGFYQNPANRSFKDNHEVVEEYDLNGNIRKLKRTGRKIKNYPAVLFDDLVYNYDGNKLTSIIDNPNGSANPSGYEGGGAPIDYDSNGNMTIMPDKGITNIAYNFLDLPNNVAQRGNTTEYSYRADGVKLKRKFTLNNALGSTTTTTEYLDGFHYSESSNPTLNRALSEQDNVTQSIKTAGEEEVFVDEYGEANRIALPNDPPIVSISLMFFPTAEGFYDFRRKQYIYQYKDQVGNTRLSYWVHPDENILKILDKNDYYPFGMNILQDSEFSATASPLNYKFGGKELQESGMYDFGARTYMPDVGRWMSIDPLAELSPDLTPFRFAFNNPISFTDPTGMYEDGYGGGGDWDDENDRDQGFIRFHWNDNYFENVPNDEYNIFYKIGDVLTLNWGVEFKNESHDASGSQGDFMADMGQEFSSDPGQNSSSGDLGNDNGGCDNCPSNAKNFDTFVDYPFSILDRDTWNNFGKTKIYTYTSLSGWEEFKYIELSVEIGRGSGIKGVKAVLSTNGIKTINSYKKLIIEHQSKLLKYIQNPSKYDNLNMLKNAPNDLIRNKIIQSRIQHLKHEIKTFHQNINKILNGQ
ncbi:RHS repeat domain-containing protein [Kaistella yonginensis]|uniref:RHS repeat domain-containing protein n=1 Tax=Kaistella yonginensis TaxID=658267 RepID=UPI0025B31F39|nr:RHS repeat-associated core domain-containing protein [Kaistella yonginensis]MDN3606387.1 RHS repeat-associated core domain-containing protein [Kaistella yonginensis]